MIIQKLLKDYITDTSTKLLVDNIEIWVVPMVNPDGHQYSKETDRNWRKNRRDNEDGTYGVDLNRNHSYNWGLDNDGSSPFTIYNT